MPGLITHYICGEAVLKSLPDRERELITVNRSLFNIGTQGPDIFFYDLPGILSNKTAGLGSNMHKYGYRLFLEKLLDGLLNCANDERSALTAYICGYITHYFMDCNAHPYIYYKSGFGRKGEIVSRVKYVVLHRKFETAIDVLMLNLLRSEKPCDKKLWQLINVSRHESAYVVGQLSSAIRETYNTPLSSSAVYRAMAATIYTTRLLQSKKGRRKRLISFVENMTIGENLISSLIHTQIIKDDIDYLNLKKNPWYNPWDNSCEHRHRFTDMFNKSVSDSVRSVCALFDYIQGTISKSVFLDLVGNNSFATGIDADEPVVFRYHDCVYH